MQLIICVPTNRHKSQAKGTTSKLLRTFQELSVTLKLAFVDRRPLRICKYVCLVLSHAAFIAASVSVRSARHKKYSMKYPFLNPSQ